MTSGVNSTAIRPVGVSCGAHQRLAFFWSAHTVLAAYRPGRRCEASHVDFPARGLAHLDRCCPSRRLFLQHGVAYDVIFGLLIGHFSLSLISFGLSLFLETSLCSSRSGDYSPLASSERFPWCVLAPALTARHLPMAIYCTIAAHIGTCMHYPPLVHIVMSPARSTSPPFFRGCHFGG